MSRYKFKACQDLQKLLALSPPAVQGRYADRLEELLLKLDAERTYPYEFVYFRITGFRPKEDRRETYLGRDLLPDLLRLLEDSSDTAPRKTSEVQGRVYDLEDLQEQCGVSVRTIHRWRRRGLVSRKYLFPDGRKRTGVQRQALEVFAQRDRLPLDRRGRPPRMTGRERAAVLRLAEELARSEGATPTAVARRIARQVGRAPETVRLALRRHDREHPDRPIFGRPARQPAAEVCRSLYAEFRQGTPVPALQQRYGRSRASIYRLINRQRALEALSRSVTCFEEDTFAAAASEQRTIGPDLRARLASLSSGEGLRPAANRPEPLSHEEEAGLFRAYNYAKFRLRRVQLQLQPKRYVPARLIREAQAFQQVAKEVRDCLLAAHLLLVEQVTRQHGGGRLDAEARLQAAHACLGEMIESFDYRGRRRFAGQLRLELLKRFARMTSQVSSAVPPVARLQ